jgi:release factor glutamine methyltransferase
MTLAAALRQGAELLEREGVQPARLTAEILLAYALRRDRTYLYSHPETELTELEWLHFGRYLHERLRGKPVQYITGRQEFYGRSFRVTPAVLIPRPETEHLVETALELAREARTAVDVGTGSGAIAVTLALEMRTRVIATDISAAALEVAAGNAERLGAEVAFVRCDLAAALAARSVDLVVSNPPYVPRHQIASLQREVRDWEPHTALCGGESGLEFYTRLAAEAERVLRPGGWLVVELGMGQHKAVGRLLSRRWSRPRIAKDLAGLPRVLAARLEA